MSTEQHNDVRICENCRVVVVPDGDRWAHPEQFRLKFSDSVCTRPAPGREAKAHEARFGLGRATARDKLVLQGAIPELAQDPGTPLSVGVDGSYKLVTGEGLVRKPMSWGYAATNGLYGLGTATTIPGRIVGSDRALQGELRAIWWALSRIGGDHPVTVITDSQDAVRLTAAWQQGPGVWPEGDARAWWLADDEVMPRGYTVERLSGRDATLVQLAHCLRAAGSRIRVQWVRGHTGHPLNEGADALAKMARAWATGRLSRETVAGDARRAVLHALTRHATLL